VLRFTVFVFTTVLFGFASTGCVTRSTFNELSTDFEETQRERDDLQNRVERLTIERDSLEDQFIVAQESYEDERIVRSALASNLEQVRQKATELDANLGAERIARMLAAGQLAAREAEISSMQSTYDELVSDLESEVSSGQIEIERLREGLRLNVSEDVLFASGSAELDTIGREVLIKVATQLGNLNDLIQVRGHTDDRRIRGSLAQRFPTNWELAAARAARVVRLLEKNGVPGDRLEVVSLGPNDPIVKNDTPDHRAMNRRIEILLIPREGAAPISAAEPPPKSPE
jgi:chemotaxis protein MotB